jgi:hypothetical protein
MQLQKRSDPGNRVVTLAHNIAAITNILCFDIAVIILIPSCVKGDMDNWRMQRVCLEQHTNLVNPVQGCAKLIYE